jgi:uncharacterized protein (DUF2141 family)
MHLSLNLSLNLSKVTKALWLPLFIVSASLASPAAQAQIPTSGSLTAEVSELKNTTGQICFSLFDSGVGFPNNPESIVATQCVSAMAQPSEGTTQPSEETAATAEPATTESAAESPTAARVTFEDLALGTYAVSVWHDENEDNQLNTGSFGIPTEGFGFSQNPVIQTSAPDFSEAAVVVVSPDSATQIDLIYY